MLPSRSSSNAHSFLSATRSAASAAGTASATAINNMIRSRTFMPKDYATFRHPCSRARLSQVEKAGDKLRLPKGDASDCRDARVVALRDITVSCVAALATHGDVVRLDQGDLVLGEVLVCAELHVQAVELRGVQAEDLLLDFAVRAAEFCLPLELLHDVVRNFQAAHGFDLPLRAAVPHRVRAPYHALRSHQVHQLADEG